MTDDDRLCVLVALIQLLDRMPTAEVEQVLTRCQIILATRSRDTAATD